MVKQFLYIIGLHWAALVFLAVAPLSCVVRWSRGMDVRCSSVFTASFLVGGVHGLWRCGQLSVTNIGQRH
jgi:hypothetical protein